MGNQKGPDHQSKHELAEQIVITTLTDFKMRSEIIVIKALCTGLKHIHGTGHSDKNNNPYNKLSCIKLVESTQC